jgi:chemotaxis family two-component system sensor kinase Cph1
MLPFPYSVKRHGVSLSNCDDEPVQTPGCIQGHGLLLALNPADLSISQVSDNCAQFIPMTALQVLGKPVWVVIGKDWEERLRQLVISKDLNRNPSYLGAVKVTAAAADDAALDVTVHTLDGVVLVELERSGRTVAKSDESTEFLSMINTTMGRLKATRSLAEFCRQVAAEVRDVTGLDRAMVYRFHPDDSGEVMADARRPDLPPWLGLRYPASDIPLPAREIFKRIGVRPLPDVGGALCEMVPLLNPVTSRPLDMTYCALRGASVMYTEYLHNMGVAATLTMPILKDGALWGLIACHHYTPKAFPFAMRSAAEFLAQVASLEITQAERRELLEYQIKIDAAHLAVLTQASRDGELAVSVDGYSGLLGGLKADGVAVQQRGRWQTAGRTPTDEQLEPLSEWLRDRSNATADGLRVYATDALGTAYAPARAYASVASGVLSTALSKPLDQVLILWFRGEQVQTYNWAGNPHEKPPVVGSIGARLTPRRSFELWQEQVRGRSAPWNELEIVSVQRLRRMVTELVVVRAERLAEANAELALSNARLASINAELDAFAYVAGHDLKEPLRGINKFAHRLLQDAESHRAQDPDRVKWLLRLTVRMDSLLDSLLHYSRVGRASMEFAVADMDAVLVESMEMLGARLAESKLQVRVPRPLPKARVDRVRVREVLSNLISNAAKYNDKEEAWAEIGYIAEGDPSPSLARPASAPPAAQDDVVWYVRDNGIGIEDRHRDRVFAIFKRLHAEDGFGGGSGAGLTIVRKMVTQHGGLVWFDSKPGVGTTFYFTLPDAGHHRPGGAHDERHE